MNKRYGWKCFDKDLRCRSHQFVVGETYTLTSKLEMCSNGWHFHENGWQLFNYYENKKETRVCEVEAEDVLSEQDKSCCRTIRVIRELGYDEICRVFGMLKQGGNGYGNGDGYGYGNGDGYGYGNGDGYGYGNGNGDGYGYGDGNGDGYGGGYGGGYGYGNGYGYGDGNGDGYGYGYGYGNGNGDGYGDGNGDGYGDGNGKYYFKAVD